MEEPVVTAGVEATIQMEPIAETAQVMDAAGEAVEQVAVAEAVQRVTAVTPSRSLWMLRISPRAA